jgi:hypothetical protein
MATKTKPDSALTGLAGEYHVLAQLAELGVQGALTLGANKAVDILAHQPSTGRLFRLEVKTTSSPPKAEKVFGTGKCHVWMMSQKHEGLVSPDLVYCFVCLIGVGSAPKVFVVPSAVVAAYVREQHAKYNAARGFVGVDTNSMRMFRVHETDPDGYSGNWGLLVRVSNRGDR